MRAGNQVAIAGIQNTAESNIKLITTYGTTATKICPMVTDGGATPRMVISSKP